MRPRVPLPSDPQHARVTRIFSEHATAAYRTLRCCGVPDADAEDGVTRVFEIVMAQLERIRPESERAFVCGVAARVASNARRALARRAERLLGRDGEQGDDSESGPTLATHGPDPEACAVNAGGRRLLMRALSEMSSRQRAVFVMCELEGFTAKEVAEALGIAETAATARRRKARAAFARFCARLRAEEQALEEGSLAVGTGSLGGGHG